MNDLIKLDYTEKEWTPLWQSETVPKQLDYIEGFKQEQLAIETCMLPQKAKEYIDQENLYESSLDFRDDCGRYGVEYFSVFEDPDLIPNHKAIKLVVRQDFETGDDSIFHINPDLIFALGLKESQKGEWIEWVKPDENDNPIIKMQVSDLNKPQRVEIKTTYLRDYLSARKLCLYLHMYSEKTFLCDCENRNSQNSNNEKNGDKYKATYFEYEVDRSGRAVGTSWALMKVVQKIANLKEDLPSTQPTDDDDIISTTSEWIHQSKDTLLFKRWRLWTYKWIEPSEQSPIVKREIDDLLKTLHYKVDFSSTTKNAHELLNSYKYLWFKPELATYVLGLKRGFIEWNTGNTGTLSFDQAQNLHFGINNSGLINILAHDVAMLAPFYQKPVNGYNVSPSCGVCAELLQIQKADINGIPNTKASEFLLYEGIKEFQSITSLLDLHSLGTLQEKINRFRALEEGGLLSLAKDINKCFTESLDKKDLKKRIENLSSPLDKNKKDLGSIKLLEILLSQMGYGDGRALCSALAYNYDLRNCDAHKESQTKIQEAYNFFDITETDMPLIKAEKLMFGVALCIWTISQKFLEYKD